MRTVTPLLALTLSASVALAGDADPVIVRAGQGTITASAVKKRLAAVPPFQLAGLAAEPAAARREFVDKVLRPRHAPTPVATIHSAEVIEFVTPEQVVELRSALASMRSDDRDLWVANGQRLKKLGEAGRALWMEWSQQSDKFDPADAARVWDSFTADRTGYQAIFAEAQR